MINISELAAVEDGQTIVGISKVNVHYITLGIHKNGEDNNTILYRDAVNNDLAPITHFVYQIKCKLIYNLAKENHFADYSNSAIYALNDAVKMVEFVSNNQDNLN